MSFNLLENMKQSSNSLTNSFTVPLQQKIDRYYAKEQTVDSLMEILFKIEERGSTIKTEIYAGLIHFLSTAIILAVNPSQLVNAGYDREKVASSTALCTGIACLLTGLLANLPFVSTPSLATAIYYSVSMRLFRFTLGQGNVCVFFLGILLMICSIRTISDAIAFLTPYSVKVGICVGFALLVSLQALTHLDLVVPGEYTVLTLGDMWHHETLIAISAFFVIGILLHYKVKGAYVGGLTFGSFLYWGIENSWPTKLYNITTIDYNVDFVAATNPHIWNCVFDLFVVSSVLLAGLSVGLADLAGISRPDGSAPRRRWLYFSCGIGTIISACFGSGPILLSVESAPGIVAGARTGLSTIVCGGCFLVSFFLYPLFASIPAAGTGPVLLMVGLLLFENTSKVDWRSIKEALPVFITAIFCAFTYSILYGVLYGTAAHIIMTTASGDMYASIKSVFTPHGSETDLLAYHELHHLHQHPPPDKNFRAPRTRLRSSSLDTVPFKLPNQLPPENDINMQRIASEEMTFLVGNSPTLTEYETFSSRGQQQQQYPTLIIPLDMKNSVDSPTNSHSVSYDVVKVAKLKQNRYRRSLSIGESSILSYDQSKDR